MSSLSRRSYQSARLGVHTERGVVEPGVGSGVYRQWHIVAVPAVVRPGIALALLALQCCHLAYGHSLRYSADRGHRLHCR